MKFTLEKSLSLAALGVLGALQTAAAAPVYEIENLTDYQLDGEGTLTQTRNGYALAINAAGQVVGMSQGKKKLSSSDVENENSDLDNDTGISPSETITYSINSPIDGNNYAFTAEQNSTPQKWVPTFSAIGGSLAPDSTDPVSHVDAYYYGINDTNMRVGSFTGEQKTVKYTGTTEGQENWYYRDFEQRGFLQLADGSQIPLLPTFLNYTNTETNKTAALGGWSVATDVNVDGLVAGYGSFGLNQQSINNINECLDDDDTTPDAICIQALQFPSATGSRGINYQLRGMIWSQTTAAEPIVLPLGLTPDNTDNLFAAQAFAINPEGTVVGRSHTYRGGDKDKLAYDAAYWTKDVTTGKYQYHWVPMGDDIRYSIAYDINDEGILVGSYNKYINGVAVNKFFYFDTKNPETGVITPSDFTGGVSELGSVPKDINNLGQVVGNIDTTFDLDTARPKEAFLFNKADDEFVNLNKLLTCESKGYEKQADGSWVRHKVEVTDGTGKSFTYDVDYKVVEANQISEDGSIVGTVFARKPVYQLDVNGDFILENGKPIFELNGYGEPLTSYVPRMVVLKPATEAAAEACTVIDDSDVDKPYERQGGAMLAWLLALPLVWLRRRK
ncbi:DUF3466 family protein [Shewanella marina]|uniref:DUF3466 family protein n=1 Tax=Shewanella marina TaxID=487319 RepID=UPI000470EFFF|nr:DUF3466 family protein [Shewanella marina]